MLTMYVKTGCPYCGRVIRAIDALGLDVEYKNRNDEGVVDELIERGGKAQFPYLVDSENEAEMYESKDIIIHLCKQYGGNPDDFNEDVANVCPID